MGSTEVVLDIVDTSEQEDFPAIREQYLRKVDVVIIRYSVTNKQSFANIKHSNRYFVITIIT